MSAGKSDRFEVSRAKKCAMRQSTMSPRSTASAIHLAACATLALLNCHEKPGRASATREAAPPGPSATRGISTPPRQAAPLGDDKRVIDLTGRGGASGSPSELHPREGADACVQMDTVCFPDGQKEKCTSARFELACSEEGRIPSTREHVRCVCP
jgi:hypothetical protein